MLLAAVQRPWRSASFGTGRLAEYGDENTAKKYVLAVAGGGGANQHGACDATGGSDNNGVLHVWGGQLAAVVRLAKVCLAATSLRSSVVLPMVLLRLVLKALAVAAAAGTAATLTSPLSSPMQMAGQL